MNKSIIKETFPAYRFAGHQVDLIVPEVSDRNSEENAVLDVVFGVDPFTGLPQNDVAVYMSDKVPQEIREFVGANLLHPMPKSEGVPDDHSDILHDLVRGVNESVSDYAVRIRDIVESDSLLREKLQDHPKSD